MIFAHRLKRHMRCFRYRFILVIKWKPSNQLIPLWKFLTSPFLGPPRVVDYCLICRGNVVFVVCAGIIFADRVGRWSPFIFIFHFRTRPTFSPSSNFRLFIKSPPSHQTFAPSLKLSARGRGRSRGKISEATNETYKADRATQTHGSGGKRWS